MIASKQEMNWPSLLRKYVDHPADWNSFDLQRHHDSTFSSSSPFHRQAMSRKLPDCPVVLDEKTWSTKFFGGPVFDPNLHEPIQYLRR